MENYTRIYLEGFGDIQLYDNVPVSLNYSVAEIQDISKKNSSFSKTINIPGTKENNELLGNLFSISIAESSFDVNRKVACKIYGADIVLMKGYFRLMGINKISENSTDGEELIEYEALVFDQTTDFYDKLSDTLLEDLDFSQYNHTYGYQSIVGSSANTSDDIYTYPMLYNNNTTFYSTQDFKPAIYLKAYIDKAFQMAQYSYESDFFESDYFKSLIIPFNGEKSYNSQNTINSRKFQVGMTGTTDFVTFSGAQSATTVLFSGYTLPFNSDNNTTIPYFDSGNTYDVSTYTYTSNANQTFDLRFRINATTYAYNPFNQQLKLYTSSGLATLNTAKINCRAYLYKNGIQVATSSNLINHNIGNTLSATANTSSQTTTLDYTFSNIAAGFNDQFQIRIKPIVDMPLQNIWRIGPGFGSSTPYYPIINIKLDVSQSGQTAGNNFYINSPQIGELSDFDTVELNNFIPRNIKIKDLFSSVLKMFNLYVEQDSDYENKLIIKTREEYYSGNTYNDWTQKLAIDKDMNIKFIPELQNKDLILTYKQDSDELNTSYFNQTKEVYGQKKYIFDNDFLSGEKKIELIFSPTPLVKNGFGLTVPGILSQSPKNNIRILYKPDSWLSQTGLTWTYRYQTSGGTYQYSTFPTYPYAGHFDKPQFPTEDINFGQTQYLFYSDYGNITDNNLSNKYYFNQVDQMLDGRLLTAYFDLDFIDILNLKFSDKVFIKDSYFIINKIQDFDPITKSLTKVELLKIDEGLKFATTNKKPVRPALENGVLLNTGITVGTVAPTKPIVRGELLSKNDPYITNTGSVVLGLTSNNTVNSKYAIVSGEDNFVEENTKAIIIGDSNTADGGAKSMIIGSGNTSSSDSSSIVIGNDNVIPAGVDSVVVFGDSITATTNNTLYANNIIISDGGTINGFTITELTSGTTSGGTVFGDYLPLSGGVMTGYFTAQTISIDSTKSIKSINGGTQIDLDPFGFPNTLGITTDNGGYTESYISMSPTTLLLRNNGGASFLEMSASDFRLVTVANTGIDVINDNLYLSSIGVNNISGQEIIIGGTQRINLSSPFTGGTPIGSLLIDSTGDIVLGSVPVGNFLPLSGGVMTGNFTAKTITIDAGETITNGYSYLDLDNGTLFGGSLTLGTGDLNPAIYVSDTIDMYGPLYFDNPSGGFIDVRNGNPLRINTSTGGNIIIGKPSNLIKIESSLNSGTSIANLAINSNGYIISATTPTLNFLPITGGTVSGISNFASLSATTLSGGTILSGGTNLYSIFAPLGNAFTGGTVAGATTFTSSVTMNEDLTVDDIYQTSHYTIQTTTNTLTTIATIATSAENVYQIEANICAGLNDTSAGYTCKMIGSFKNNGGTLSQIGSLNFIENIDSALITPGATMTISGQNVLVRVSGQTSSTIDWGCSLIINRMQMGII